MIRVWEHHHYDDILRICACILLHQEWIRKGREYLTPVYLPVKALFEVQSMFSTATVIINAHNISGSAPVALFTTV